MVDIVVSKPCGFSTSCTCLDALWGWPRFSHWGTETLAVEALDDAAVSGPIPIYVSVPAKEYSALLSADAEARADAVFEAMEEETYPVGDVDKLHAATYRVLVELVGEKDAEAIVYGGTDLDPQQETDGLRGNEAGSSISFRLCSLVLSWGRWRIRMRWGSWPRFTLRRLSAATRSRC